MEAVLNFFIINLVDNSQTFSNILEHPNQPQDQLKRKENAQKTASLTCLGTKLRESF
jgi:hypothetical protein